MDNGEEKIEDESLVRQLRSQAKVVYRKAALLTLVLTILFFLLPG